MTFELRKPRNVINWEEIDPKFSEEKTIKDLHIETGIAETTLRGHANRHELPYKVDDSKSQSKLDWDSVKDMWGTSRLIDIAEKLGVTKQWVSKYGRENKLIELTPSGRKVTKYDWNRIDPMFATRTIKDISASTSIAAGVLRGRARKAGIAFTEAPKPSIWDWESVEDLWGKCPMGKIAEDLGCSLNTAIRYAKKHGKPALTDWKRGRKKEKGGE